MRTGQILILSLLLLISGCDQGLQGENVRNLGDAIDHCRTYSRNVLIKDVVISLDQISTREQGGYYFIFLNLDTQEKHGFASCQVDMDGLIVSYSAPGFHKNTGAFSQFN